MGFNQKIVAKIYIALNIHKYKKAKAHAEKLYNDTTIGAYDILADYYNEQIKILQQIKTEL